MFEYRDDVDKEVYFDRTQMLRIRHRLNEKYFLILKI